MKTLFIAEAISKGGRSGTIQTPDRLLNVTLGNPLEKGIEKRGPSPELLFAGAYSACYHGALSNAAKKLGTPVKDSTVRALVSLIEDDQGGYRLGVELHAQLPGIDRGQAQRIMDEAHKTCPYSKALRGDTSVKLVGDGPGMPAPSARETVPNPFGGMRSLPEAASTLETAHLADAEHLPLKNTNKIQLHVKPGC